MNDMYGQPGERYSAIVQGQHPYVEWTQRQSRALAWDDQPFNFYFQKKVRPRARPPARLPTRSQARQPFKVELD